MSMNREYAVVKAAGPDTVILFSTPGFAAERTTEKISLSDGAELWINGTYSSETDNAALLKQLRELEDANRAKEAFLSSMSHDIRTPMNAIIGMTALARRHIDEKQKVADSLSKIETASAHLLSLINEVLDMSRINSGRMVIADEAFSLSDLLHDTLTIVRPQAEQKNHAFIFSTGSIIAESLYGDVLRLRQIFVNIINNAIKYTNDGGRIEVTVSEEPHEDGCMLVFTCRDNGVGMTPEFLEKIYDPFERANTTTNSRIEGTGLGMSIVRRLVEAMAGTIHIESKPGAGTLVTISIPLRSEELQISTAALNGKKLLVIENDPELKNTYRTYLDEFHIAHRIVASDSEAVEAMTEAEFRSEPFSGVILGNTIESRAGVFDIAAYFRKAYPGMPLILVSSADWDKIEYRAVRSGIDHYIPVPFFRKTLINGLNSAFLAQEAGIATPESVDLSGRHILLAEDNLINREIAKEILSATNAVIDTAENGEEAVSLYMQSPEGAYDLILMDIQMPVMNGYDATAAIRSSGRKDAGTILIFAMTANTFAEDIAKAREAGMNGHIAKPLDIPKLMNTLRQIMR